MINMVLIAVLITSSSTLHDDIPDHSRPISGFDLYANLTEDDELNSSKFEFYSVIQQDTHQNKYTLELTYISFDELINLSLIIFTIHGFREYETSANSTVLESNQFDLENDNPKIGGAPADYQHVLVIQLDLVEDGYIHFEGVVIYYRIGIAVSIVGLFMFNSFAALYYMLNRSSKKKDLRVPYKLSTEF